MPKMNIKFGEGVTINKVSDNADLSNMNITDRHDTPLNTDDLRDMSQENEYTDHGSEAAQYTGEIEKQGYRAYERMYGLMIPKFLVGARDRKLPNAEKVANQAVDKAVNPIFSCIKDAVIKRAFTQDQVKQVADVYEKVAEQEGFIDCFKVLVNGVEPIIEAIQHPDIVSAKARIRDIKSRFGI